MDKHAAQKLADEFDQLSIKEVHDGLKANPPGTAHTIAEQWPFIRPALGLLTRFMPDNAAKTALIDFISVADAELGSNYPGGQEGEENENGARLYHPVGKKRVPKK